MFKHETRLQSDVEWNGVLVADRHFIAQLSQWNPAARLSPLGSVIMSVVNIESLRRWPSVFQGLGRCLCPRIRSRCIYSQKLGTASLEIVKSLTESCDANTTLVGMLLSQSYLGVVSD